MNLSAIHADDVVSRYFSTDRRGFATCPRLIENTAPHLLLRCGAALFLDQNVYSVNDSGDVAENRKQAVDREVLCASNLEEHADGRDDD